MPNSLGFPMTNNIMKLYTYTQHTHIHTHTNTHKYTQIHRYTNNIYLIL